MEPQAKLTNDSFKYMLAKAIAKVRELCSLLFKLLRLIDTFDKRYCIIYTLSLILGLHSCNYQQ